MGMISFESSSRTPFLHLLYFFHTLISFPPFHFIPFPFLYSQRFFTHILSTSKGCLMLAAHAKQNCLASSVITETFLGLRECVAQSCTASCLFGLFIITCGFIVYGRQTLAARFMARVFAALCALCHLSFKFEHTTRSRELLWLVPRCLSLTIYNLELNWNWSRHAVVSIASPSSVRTYFNVRANKANLWLNSSAACFLHRI